MTIAAGFRCRDGVVICADREYTEGSLRKFIGSKTALYEEPACKLIFTFCGDWDFANMAVEEIFERTKRSGKSPLEIRTIVKAELQQLYNKHIYRHPGYKDGTGPDVSFLIAIWTGQGRADLWVTSRTTLNRVGSWETIGAGHYLVASLGSTLFADSLDVHEAALLGSYLLLQAKEHVPGCGGNSTILTVSADGNVKTQDSANVLEGEAYFSDFNDMVRRMFYAFGNLELPDDQVKLIVSETLDKAMTYRTKRIKYKEMFDRDQKLMTKLKQAHADGSIRPS
jgi:hypothetical protein